MEYNIPMTEILLKLFTPNPNIDVDPIEFLFVVIFLSILGIISSVIMDLIIFAGEEEAKSLKRIKNFNKKIKRKE